MQLDHVEADERCCGAQVGTGEKAPHHSWLNSKLSEMGKTAIDIQSTKNSHRSLSSFSEEEGKKEIRHSLEKT